MKAEKPWQKAAQRDATVVALKPPAPPRPTYRFSGTLPSCPALDELISQDQWLAWDHLLKETATGWKWTKPPRHARTGHGCNGTAMASCAGFAIAAATVRRRDLAGVGFSLQKDDEYTGIDLDACRDEVTGELAPWAREIVGFGESYWEVSPSGRGLRAIVRGKIDAAIKSDAAGVEMYAEGRYLTITGDMLPEACHSINPAPRTIEAIRARALSHGWKDPKPEAPQAERSLPATIVRAPGSGGDFFRNVNDLALENHERFARALFGAKARRFPNGAMRITSKALGRDFEEDLSITAQGIEDFGPEVKMTAVDLVMRERGAEALEAAKWICALFGVEPASMGMGRADDDAALAAIGAASAANLTRHLRVVSVNECGDVYDQSTGEVLASPPAALIAPTETEWERPDGIIGEIAEWIYDTTPRSPNWSFATIAAASLVGTVSSRHACGPTQTGTHLYIAMIGETACGKDRPLRACHQLLHAAGLSCLAISGDFKSQAFLEQQIGRSPVALAAVDEVGSQLLGRLSSRRVSSHESGISGLLRSLWSTGETMQMSGSLTRESITVSSPALSIIGASTPEEFYDSLTSTAVSNGFLNRFLIVKGKRNKRPGKRADGRIVPKHVAHALLSLLPTGIGNLGDGVAPLVGQVAPSPNALEWESDAVSDAYEAFDDELVERRDEDKVAGSLLSRTAEMSLRLAAIHAYSRVGKLAKLSMRDWEWGKTVASRSADIMVRDVRAHMSENDYHAKHLLIKRLLQESGTLTRSQLIKRIHGRIPPRDTDSVLADLIEAQDVIMIAGTQAGNGKAVKIYTYNSR